MQLTKAPKNWQQITQQTTIGFIAIAALLIIFHLLVEGFKALGFSNPYTAIATLLGLVPLLWVVGHILSGEEDRCVCRESYYNLFSEWYHKRSCLPFLTSENFRGKPR